VSLLIAAADSSPRGVYGRAIVRYVYVVAQNGDHKINDLLLLLLLGSSHLRRACRRVLGSRDSSSSTIIRTKTISFSFLLQNARRRIVTGRHGTLRSIVIDCTKRAISSSGTPEFGCRTRHGEQAGSLYSIHWLKSERSPQCIHAASLPSTEYVYSGTMK
jgi:hypothetical protein